jgi:hypothetical protein
MTRDEAKLAYALVSLYSSLYKGKYGRVPVVNKHREKWAMNDVIDSVGYDRAKVLLEYYFTTNKNKHPIDWFFYNFEKLDAALNEREKDKVRRLTLMSRTKLMVEERDNEH